MDYDAFDKMCEEVQLQNNEYLDAFRLYLGVSGLKEATIKKHLQNVSLYINDYLLHDEIIHMKDGLDRIDQFFEDFFIRKCLWSSPATVKSTAASLKKFYKCMAINGYISDEDYEDFASEIKDMLPVWQDLCEDYDDGSFFDNFYKF